MNAKPLLISLSAFVLLFGSFLSAQEELPKVAEFFRVGQVGASQDPNAREKLLTVYGEVARQFNEQAAAEFEEKTNAFAGQRVRIIKKMDETDANGQLYLAAYDGAPSVVSLPSADYEKGDTTPPLEIEADGTYVTKVTRMVDVEVDGTPSTTTPSSDLVSFFGITLDVGGTPVKKREQREVTTTETLNKYKATLSEIELEKPITMNKDIFLDTLKNGGIYEVKTEEERRCQDCRGFGRVQNDGTAPKVPDGKMPCRGCYGKGKVRWDVTYIVTW